MSKASEVRKKIKAKSKTKKSGVSMEARAKKVAKEYDVSYSDALAYVKSQDRRSRAKAGAKSLLKGARSTGKTLGKGAVATAKYLDEVKKYDEKKKKEAASSTKKKVASTKKQTGKKSGKKKGKKPTTVTKTVIVYK